jgi:hypothetical protein
MISQCQLNVTISATNYKIQCKLKIGDKMHFFHIAVQRYKMHSRVLGYRASFEACTTIKESAGS